VSKENLHFDNRNKKVKLSDFSLSLSQVFVKEIENISGDAIKLLETLVKRL